MTNTTDKLREMSTSEHVKVLEDLRVGVAMDAHHLDDGPQKLAALDAAIAALKAFDAEPDVDLELIWNDVSDNAETNAAYRRLKARLAAREGGDGARVTEAEWRATDAEIREWADRHGLDGMSVIEARCAFEDARTAHLVAQESANG